MITRCSHLMRSVLRNYFCTATRVPASCDSQGAPIQRRRHAQSAGLAPAAERSAHALPRLSGNACARRFNTCHPAFIATLRAPLPWHSASANAVHSATRETLLAQSQNRSRQRTRAEPGSPKPRKYNPRSTLHAPRTPATAHDAFGDSR